MAPRTPRSWVITTPSTAAKIHADFAKAGLAFCIIIIGHMLRIGFTVIFRFGFILLHYDLSIIKYPILTDLTHPRDTILLPAEVVFKFLHLYWFTTHRAESMLNLLNLFAESCCSHNIFIHLSLPYKRPLTELAKAE